MQNHKMILGLLHENQKMHNMCACVYVCVCVHVCTYNYTSSSDFLMQGHVWN